MLPLKLSKEFSSEKVRKKRESKLTTTIEKREEREGEKKSICKARQVADLT